MKKQLKLDDLKVEVDHRIVSCEAVEIFNQKLLTLDDATILADSVFKGINVNNVDFCIVDDNSNEAVADLLHRIAKHTLMYIIQESSDWHIKVTFITSIPFFTFYKFLSKEISVVRQFYHCNLTFLL